MKSIQFGDLLSVEHGIIVHGCNARGMMNSGVAKQVREKWPACFEAYLAHCTAIHRRVEVGTDYDEAILGSVTSYKVDDGLWVVNAITQLDYGRDPDRRYVSYKAIQEAFHAIRIFAMLNREPMGYALPIHYPQIGAGLGNGDWSLISSIIDTELRNHDHTLWVREV